MGLYADYVFPWIVERLEGADVQQFRRRCVSAAHGHVLEVGFGTGKTLPFYDPALAQLTIVEPSFGMNRKTKSMLECAPFQTELHPIKGESLPFEADTFDSCVCTMTLCSVDSPSRVLSEIRRVLQPGGSYHFMEHVLSEQAAVARRQRRFNPIQRWLGCGCNLNRDTERDIQSAGFRIAEIQRVTSQDVPAYVSQMFPIILGHAHC